MNCLMFMTQTYDEYSEIMTPAEVDYPLKEAKTFGEAAGRVMNKLLAHQPYEGSETRRKKSEPNDRINYTNQIFKLCSEFENISESFQDSVSEGSENQQRESMPKRMKSDSPEKLDKPMAGFRANLIKITTHSPVMMKVVCKYITLKHLENVDVNTFLCSN